jgi:alkanesulfonate monooxygenase SsuD/methylene tetrahydromethanopterin reductase-like flavin-dependent oxidoreductase (luciferase family)
VLDKGTSLSVVRERHRRHRRKLQEFASSGIDGYAEAADHSTALAIAGLLWNVDLSDRDADGPLPPEDPVIVENTGAFGARRVNDPRAVVARWREQSATHGWSLRETVIELGPQRGHVGTPGGLADKFARFARHGAVDGFNISPYLIPDGLDDIVDRLVPELQERGVYPAAYHGTTLRDHLGLRAPSARRLSTPSAWRLSTPSAWRQGAIA